MHVSYDIRARKRVEYKLIHICQKYCIQSAKTVQISQKIAKYDITEHFKSKQQKSFISLNTLTTLLKFFQSLPRSNFNPTMAPLLLC